MKWLLTTFIIASLLTGLAARAGQYKEITTENEPRILVTGPDSFKNRLRYWFIMADGSPSIYWVVEKIGAGKYQETNVNNESGAIRLIFKGDTTARQHRYVGKVVSVETFKKQ